MANAMDAEDAIAVPTKWSGDSDLIKQANEMAEIMLMNQRIVDALMESFQKGCISIDL